MNFSKLIFGIYSVVFLAVIVWAGGFFLQMHREYVALKVQETANQRRLVEATAKLDSQEKYLDQLRHDPVLVEQLIREKLHFAKEQEFIFRFDDATK
ncbi:MAG: septum formation initiator family protein [Lacunisphaera sp.]